MIDLKWTSREVDSDSVMVGYSCPCGCTPAVTYRQGSGVVSEGCCCGNHMAVGEGAGEGIDERPGYRVQSASVVAPWREAVPVVWAIGPSTHPEPDTHSHHEGHPALQPGQVTDPVCGMTVDISVAIAKDLHATHQGADYYFCGKGCKLDFVDEPDRFLAPGYVPSM